MKTPAWQKPTRWWAPWRQRALLREWERQLRCTREAERNLLRLRRLREEGS